MVSLSFSFSLFIHVSVSVFLYLSVSVYLFLFLSLSLSLYLSLFTTGCFDFVGEGGDDERSQSQSCVGPEALARTGHPGLCMR